MKRFQNRSDGSGVGILEPGRQFEQEHSGCVGDDLFEISEVKTYEAKVYKSVPVFWATL